MISSLKTTRFVVQLSPHEECSAAKFDKTFADCVSFTFHPSVLLLTIKISQSAPENPLRYCKKRYWNQDYYLAGKLPRKSTPIWNILHEEIQTYPQLPIGMQRMRGPFVLVTIWTYLDRPFVRWHSLIRPFHSFPRPIHVCTYCFIHFTYLPHS